jgi:hypothetical protein
MIRKWLLPLALSLSVSSPMCSLAQSASTAQM